MTAAVTSVWRVPLPDANLVLGPGIPGWVMRLPEAAREVTVDGSSADAGGAEVVDLAGRLVVVVVVIRSAGLPARQHTGLRSPWQIPTVARTPDPVRTLKAG